MLETFRGILTYLLTYLLTPWSRVLLEKLASLQLVKIFPVEAYNKLVIKQDFVH